MNFSPSIAVQLPNTGLREAYLHLLKRSLTDTVHAMTASIRGDDLILNPTHASSFRLNGTDWPYFAETMAGLKRLDNTQYCIEQVLAEKVPGDLIETGVWRGGMTVFMRGVLKAWGVTDRDVFVCDSFAGLPPPDVQNYPQDAKMVLHEFPYLAVSMEQVADNFARYGLLDDHIKFVKGFFRDTLPHLRGHQWSVIRLDGDMYESTMDGLVNLYDGLSPGGYLILDDYHHVPESAQATNDFRARHNITEPIERIDAYSAFWKKRAA